MTRRKKSVKRVKKEPVWVYSDIDSMVKKWKLDNNKRKIPPAEWVILNLACEAEKDRLQEQYEESKRIQAIK